MAMPRVPGWRAIALTAIALPAIFILMQQRGPDAAPIERSGSQRDRLERIERELQVLSKLAASDRYVDSTELESRIDALKRDVAESRAKARPTTQAESQSTDQGEPRPMTDEAPVQRAGLLDEKFADEAADPYWSAAAAQDISRSLESPGLENTQLGDVRCRATLCRIEASHSSVEAEREFIAHIGQIESFHNAEGFAERVPRSDGSIATTMFVSRSGQRLPTPPTSQL